MKVGGDLADDVRRAAIIRDEIGPERKLMMDANQVWDVGTAIERMAGLARFDPLWIEEPTSPDDILGHAAIARAVAPIGVATGEHVPEPRDVQAAAAGRRDPLLPDRCRAAGRGQRGAGRALLAAKRGVTVCPHAGGVGLCELVQHLALFDAIRVAPDVTDRVVEYVDHLHEHFADPVVMRDGAYVPPEAPGYSAEILPESRARYAFPQGSAWS